MNCECGCEQPIPNAWRHRPPYYLVGHIERIPCGCGCGGVIEWPHDNDGRRPVRLPGHTTPAQRAKHAAQRTEADPNPEGLCQCGCAGATAIARWTNARTGAVKGRRSRYLPYHHLRLIKRGPGRYTNSNGYVLLRRPDHPDAVKGYVWEHRLIAAESLGRPLRPDEDVHHINGIRDDNRPENLAVLVKREHGAIHGRGHTYRR